MSKIISTIATHATTAYQRNHTPKSFFGMSLEQINKDELESALEVAISNSPMPEFVSFVKNKEEMQKELDERISKTNEALAKKEADFLEEVKEAKAKFDHELELKTITFEREQELKKLEMEHNERMFVAESKFTEEFITNELNNAANIHEAELDAQKAAFESELKIATEKMQSEIEHARSIADAEIAKAKAESEILYTYDATILAKKIKSEVSNRYDALLEIANRYGAAQELIARLEDDKAYFQALAEARIERSEDVTDALIDKINTKECKPVTVNVTEVKKSKKD